MQVLRYGKNLLLLFLGLNVVERVNDVVVRCLVRIEIETRRRLLLHKWRVVRSQKTVKLQVLNVMKVTGVQWQWMA